MFCHYCDNSNQLIVVSRPPLNYKEAFVCCTPGAPRNCGDSPPLPSPSHLRTLPHAPPPGRGVPDPRPAPRTRLSSRRRCATGSPTEHTTAPPPGGSSQRRRGSSSPPTGTVQHRRLDRQGHRLDPPLPPLPDPPPESEGRGRVVAPIGLSIAGWVLWPFCCLINLADPMNAGWRDLTLAPITP